ncbi:MAG: GNAT family N-acetyltransferase [Rhodospirillales bacterium]|jgi:RimJ/RimL family protein N-acetyltransferase|nr:GNAT family N-acetyltransferase [Rhodospirillales bacterium]
MPDPDIHFRKADARDESLLLSWLAEPHVQEFWDNSIEHRNNMLGFLSGTKDLYDYWVGTRDGEDAPYCLLLTSDANDGAAGYMLDHLNLDGPTWTVDYMIGSLEHVGKGLGAQTLEGFCEYINTLTSEASAFLIDPEEGNARAVHVYEQAGFVVVNTFTPEEGSFQRLRHLLMKKQC